MRYTMKNYNESLHALKVEHKRVNVEICNERDRKLNEVKKLIVMIQVYNPGDASVQTLRDLLAMIRKEAERQLRKQHRTYVWRQRELLREMAELSQ